MIAGTVCAGEETLSVDSLLTNMQEAAIPSTDTDWAFPLGGWSSKYVTEGLDRLPGSGIWEVAPSILKNLTFSAWYAGGDSANYDELDLVLGYAWNLGSVTVNPVRSTNSILRRIIRSIRR